jgi:hypothetical protein
MPKKPDHDIDVQRAHLLVADFERAMRVYRDVLGFKVNFLMDALPRVPWEMFELPEHARCRVAFLSEGKGVFGTLAMTEVTGIELPRATPPYRCTIIIEVREGLLFPMVEKLKALGLDVGSPLRLDGPPRTDISFSDFDGNRILLFEVYPREKRRIADSHAQ